MFRSLGLAVEDLAAAERAVARARAARRRDRGRAVIELRRDRGGARADRRRRGAHAAGAPAHVEDAPAEIYLKLETLQPIGSFKIRGATNAIRMRARGAGRDGLVTASAGNMAQGVAWAGARARRCRRRSRSPSTRPQAKLARSSGWAAGS